LALLPVRVPLVAVIHAKVVIVPSTQDFGGLHEYAVTCSNSQKFGVPRIFTAYGHDILTFENFFSAPGTLRCAAYCSRMRSALAMTKTVESTPNGVVGLPW
jgi:hypothetical protein